MFVGMDVHRNRTQVCLLEDDGAEVYNRNVPNDQACLIQLLEKLEAGTPVVFEALYGAAWLAERLEGSVPRATPGPPLWMQGHRFGQAQIRQAGCPHPGQPAPHRVPG